MEYRERKTPRVYNYARLRKKQQSIENVTHQLIKKDQKINQLTRGYTSLICGVHKCSENIHKGVQENICQPKNDEQHRIKLMLLRLQQTTSDLERLAIKLNILVQDKSMHCTINCQLPLINMNNLCIIVIRDR